jgi:coenzyme F420-reducing hydrogenase alpha subunit
MNHQFTTDDQLGRFELHFSSKFCLGGVFAPYGTVDENNCPNIYDGMIRVVNPEGQEFVKCHPCDYTQHISEHIEPWTYLKFPYLNVYVSGNRAD